MITPPTTQDDLHLKSDNNHTTPTVTKPVTQSTNASKTTTVQTGTQAPPQPSSQAAAASNGKCKMCMRNLVYTYHI